MDLFGNILINGYYYLYLNMKKINTKENELLDKFIIRLNTYKWESDNGSSFRTTLNKIDLSLSSYSLQLTFKEPTKENISGHSFQMSEYPQLAILYHKLSNECVSNAINEIFNNDVELAREFSLESLME